VRSQYIDVVKCWQGWTGKQATCEADRLAFDNLNHSFQNRSMSSDPVVTPRTSANDFADLTTRTARLLVGQGLTTAQQVIELYPEALLAIRGFGYKSLREVERCFLPGQHYDPRQIGWHADR
jgi:DNA-directed RNA polymerase alpha subunit